MPGNTSLELTIPQLQLLPTLSLLLGIPIPFGSIGSVSPDLWALGSPTRTAEEQLPHLRSSVPLLFVRVNLVCCSRLESNEGQHQCSPRRWIGCTPMMVFVCLFVCDDGGAHYRDALAKNAWQVHRYLLEYNGGRGGGRFNDARLSECLQLHTLSGQLHNRSLKDAGRERLRIMQAHICSMPLAAVIFEPPAETYPNLPPTPPPPFPICAWHRHNSRHCRGTSGVPDLCGESGKRPMDPVLYDPNGGWDPCVVCCAVMASQ